MTADQISTLTSSIPGHFLAVPAQAGSTLDSATLEPPGQTRERFNEAAQGHRLRASSYTSSQDCPDRPIRSSRDILLTSGSFLRLVDLVPEPDLHAPSRGDPDPQARFNLCKMSGLGHLVRTILSFSTCCPLETVRLPCPFVRACTDTGWDELHVYTDGFDSHSHCGWATAAVLQRHDRSFVVG